MGNLSSLDLAKLLHLRAKKPSYVFFGTPFAILAPSLVCWGEGHFFFSSICAAI